MTRRQGFLAFAALMAILAIGMTAGPTGLLNAALIAAALGCLTLQVWTIRALWRLRRQTLAARAALTNARARFPELADGLAQALRQTSQGLDGVEDVWKLLARFGGWRGALLRLVWKRFTAPSAS